MKHNIAGKLTVSLTAALMVTLMAAVLPTVSSQVAAGAQPATRAAEADRVVISDDFETNTGGWRGRGSATISIADDAHQGSHSVLVSGRTANWNGIETDVTSLFAAGQAYTVSAWVKLSGGSAPTDLKFTIAETPEAYTQVSAPVAVTSAAWVRLDGTYTMPSTVTAALLYIEAASPTTDFLVDDIVVSSATAPGVQTDIASLKDVLPWPVGVAIDDRETTGAAAELVTKHFGQLTPENYLKPESIQPSEGAFTFEATDRLVDFAIANDQRFYGHTLVWHSQTPAWFFLHADGTPLTNSPADQQILTHRMQTHITTVADHFRAKYGEFGTPGNPVVAFDVVNEAIAEDEADGLRHSRWYDVLGEGFLDLAFQFASEAFNGGADDGPVTLFLNDYGTESPAKRQAMFDVVSRMLDRGVPVDGLGHQFHVTLAQPIPQMKASIDKFSELGLRQAVTELDVQIDGVVTDQKVVDQGYFYADTFDMLRQFPDLFSVTLWGPYDSRSWLPGAPLPFDSDLQAKPAYYGIVDRSLLPARTLAVTAPAADIPLDSAATISPQWGLLPTTPIGPTDPNETNDATGFSVRWAADHLTVYVRVVDSTPDPLGDSITIFAGGTSVVVLRGSAPGSSASGGSTPGVTTETDDGFVAVAQLPLTGLDVDRTVPFDIRLVDSSAGTTTSWNDPSHAQEDGARLGTATLVSAIRYAEIPRAAIAPSIDGLVDAAWAAASTVQTDVQVVGSGGATADVRMLWSGGRLNLLFRVTDSVLDESATNAYERDSVEIFLDPVNAKAGGFLPADGQYRVSFSNAQSISGDAAVIGGNLTSATSITADGYIVEASLPLGGEPADGALIGLDLQVNDAAAGVRNSVRSWADPTGRSYLDTTRWGVARLVGAAEQPIGNLEPPAISGTAAVGNTLGSTGGSWSIASPTLSYQWIRAGEPIAGAESPTYRLTPDDAGRSIAVRVTAAGSGYLPTTVESGPVSVARLASTTRGTPSRFISFGGRGVSYDIRVSALDRQATGTVTVLDNGRPIGSVELDAADSGRATLGLDRLARGIHILSCRYDGDEQLIASVCPPRLVIVF